MIAVRRAALALSLLLAPGGLALADKAPAPAPAPSAPAPAKPVPAAPAPYQIGAIRAFLYYHGAGTFDTRDAIAGPFALWNTVIGEGDAKEPSVATLVQVELSGPSFSNIGGAVEIAISAESAKPVRHKFDAGRFFSGNGKKVVIPVLVQDTGCAELRIDVSFTTPDKKKLKKRERVGFACGE